MLNKVQTRMNERVWLEIFNWVSESHIQCCLFNWIKAIIVGFMVAVVIIANMDVIRPLQSLKYCRKEWGSLSEDEEALTQRDRLCLQHLKSLGEAVQWFPQVLPNHTDSRVWTHVDGFWTWTRVNVRSLDWIQELSTKKINAWHLCRQIEDCLFWEVHGKNCLEQLNV